MVSASCVGFGVTGKVGGVGVASRVVVERGRVVVEGGRGEVVDEVVEKTTVVVDDDVEEGLVSVDVDVVSVGEVEVVSVDVVEVVVFSSVAVIVVFVSLVESRAWANLKYDCPLEFCEVVFAGATVVVLVVEYALAGPSDGGSPGRSEQIKSV